MVLHTIMNPDSLSEYVKVQTALQLVSLEAFYRSRRPLVDGWVILFSVAVMLAVAIVVQVFLGDVYDRVLVKNGEKILDANFPTYDGA